MAEDQCTICFERLGSDKLAALPCRHVYHHTCIAHWMRASRQGRMPCPICKRYTDPSGIVGPLYIDCLRIERGKNNSRDQPIVIDDSNKQSSTLTTADCDREEADQVLRVQLKEWQARAKQAEDKSSQLAVRITQLENQNSNLRRIKKVVDLDVNMEWSGSGSQMEHLRGLPHEDLLVAFDALRTRCSKAESNARQYSEKIHTLQQEKAFFEKKFNQVNIKAQKLRREKRRQAESANNISRPNNYKQSPSIPGLLMNYTTITTAPSGSSKSSRGLDPSHDDKERRNSITEDGAESSETGDEMDPISSKRSGKRPMIPRKRPMSDFLPRSPTQPHESPSKEPFDTASAIWGLGDSDDEDYSLTVVEPRYSSRQVSAHDLGPFTHSPNTSSIDNERSSQVIDLTDD